jgi:S1-C subfamily serine protease
MSQISQVLISQVIGSSLSKQFGFRADDRVQTINGDPTTSLAQAFDALAKVRRGGNVEILVIRDGQLLTLQLSL